MRRFSSVLNLALSENPCGTGNFSARKGSSECDACPPGHLCMNATTTEPTPCPKGHFCKTATSVQPCKTGTYNPVMKANKEEFCLPCPPGRYCAGTGNSAVTGPCDGGFLCLQGADGKNALTKKVGFAEPCPVGHYCPEGTAFKRPCPPGRIREKPGAIKESDCDLCSLGHFCLGGRAEADGPCAPRYHCEKGSSDPKPANSLCPPQFRCPNGTKIACPKNSWNKLKGQIECFPCPDGFLCPDGAKDPVKCPVGSFCTKGEWRAKTNSALQLCSI